jgi:hypothetical protein
VLHEQVSYGTVRNPFEDRHSWQHHRLSNRFESTRASSRSVEERVRLRLAAAIRAGSAAAIDRRDLRELAHLATNGASGASQLRQLGQRQQSATQVILSPPARFAPPDDTYAGVSVATTRRSNPFSQS